MGEIYRDVEANVTGRGRLKGTLVLEDGELVFEAAPATPEAKAEVLRWPLPKLTDGADGPVLRTMSIPGGAVVMLVGPIERGDTLVLRNVDRVMLDASLRERGAPRDIGELTRAAQSLRSLRSWGILFLMIGLGNPTLIGATFCGLGLWVLLGHPVPAMVLGSCLNFAAMACDNLVRDGVGFWFALMTWCAVSDLLQWRRLAPLAKDPANAAWLAAHAESPRTQIEGAPAGYLARTVAFVLSALVACLGLIYTVSAFLTPAVDNVLFSAVFFAATLWYLLVCVYPVRASALARRVAPASGPVAVILLPVFFFFLVTVVIIRFAPRAPLR